MFSKFLFSDMEEERRYRKEERDRETGSGDRQVAEETASHSPGRHVRALQLPSHFHCFHVLQTHTHDIIQVICQLAAAACL